MKKFKNSLVTIIPIILIVIMASLYLYDKVVKNSNLFKDTEVLTTIKDKLKTSENTESSVNTARIVANGDILYHDVLYWSAKKEDGSYDFDPYFEYVKERISGADLAIGDFEGTISDKHPLNGYPLFNAPKEAATSMKNVGYDVVDLAHNHILDSNLYGLKYTYNEFKNNGLTPIGVHVEKSREEGDITIKEVNGIKIAILAYAYGFNSMENTLTKEEYNYYMADLNEEKIKADLAKAEQLADVTVVMPQMGVEYELEPTEEQKELYKKMIDWGADVVLGGHPHVVEPAEIVEKDGDKKLIIYSMGNFISNQRSDMMAGLGVKAKWPERGLLMDITFEKKDNKTTIKDAKAHPTLVVAQKNGKMNGIHPLYDYRVIVVEDFLAGGKYGRKFDATIQEKIENTYNEMNVHVGLNWN